MVGRHSQGNLNENLAREILELHTVGVRGGYAQADVTNFAKIITGWTILPPYAHPGGGEFVFNPNVHEPGAQTVIGKVYRRGGVEQGRAVLADLARHPATARHVAEKFARAFVADAPPELIERLARCFLDTGGNLKELARALLRAPEAWAAPRTKLKKPGAWYIAALRATDARPPDATPVIVAQSSLGEPLWRPDAPKGFPDDSATWLDGVAQRLELAHQLAGVIVDRVEPAAAVDSALGPLASRETREAIAAAGSRWQALAMLLMAPEFQRS
jgi:uncharacterized protein (DUF1800 family)